MAKPSPMLPVLAAPGSELMEAAAEGTPIICPEQSASAPWLLVRIWPSLRMTSPEPETAADPFLTRMVTTDGNSFPATVVALHAVAPEVETDGSLPPLEHAPVIAAATNANTRAEASQPRR